MCFSAIPTAVGCCSLAHALLPRAGQLQGFSPDTNHNGPRQIQHAYQNRDMQIAKINQNREASCQGLFNPSIVHALLCLEENTGAACTVVQALEQQALSRRRAR